MPISLPEWLAGVVGFLICIVLFVIVLAIPAALVLRVVESFSETRTAIRKRGTRLHYSVAVVVPAAKLAAFLVLLVAVLYFYITSLISAFSSQ